jgi:hypothetical protein
MPIDIARYSIELFKQGGASSRSSTGTPMSRSRDQSTKPVSNAMLAGLSCFVIALGRSPEAIGRHGERVAIPRY